MKLLKLYESILATSGRVVESGGYVSINNNLFTGSDQNDPLLIGGKRLVLPTREHLADPDKSEKILFHPMSEKIVRGESEVVANLRAALVIRINYTVAAIVSSLLEICASINKHKTLTPDQAEILILATDCDENTCKVFNNFLNKCLSTESSFVKIYLKRSGVIRGTKHSRAGIVSFPFYEELKESKDNLYGVKFRKKDREIIMKMLEFIYPNISTPEAYNVGSDSTIAPFMDSLMRTFMTMASPLNDILELYQDKIEGFDKLQFNMDWVSAFDDLNELQTEIRLIPPQAGNEGEPNKTDQAYIKSSTSVVNYVAPVEEKKQPMVQPPWNGNPVTQPTGRPMATPPPMPATRGAPEQSTGTKASFRDIMNSNPSMNYGNNQNAFPPSLMPDIPPGGPRNGMYPPGSYPPPGMQMQPPPGMTPQQFMEWQQYQTQMAMQGGQNPQQQYPGMMPQQYPQQYPPQYPPQYPQQFQRQPGPGEPRTMTSVMPVNPVMPNGGQQWPNNGQQWRGW